MPTVPLMMYTALGDRLAKHQAQLIGIAEVVSESENVSVLIQKARNLFTVQTPEHFTRRCTCER
jgi:hypothetical protein